MSTPRIPPVPPKGGELDKTAPSTQHRRVEKVDKIEKVPETDDESKARQQFRSYVDAKKEESSNLPTPFALFAKDSSGSITDTAADQLGHPPLIAGSDTGVNDAAESALSTPPYSPPPSTWLNNTAADEDEGDTPLPHSSDFWMNVNEPPDITPSPENPQMEEMPRSAGRTFFNKEEEKQKPKTAPLKTEEERRKGKVAEEKKGVPSPIELPQKLARTSKEGSLIEKKSEEEGNMPALQEEPLSTVPKGTIASEGKVKYVKALPLEKEAPTPISKKEREGYLGPSAPLQEASIPERALSREEEKPYRTPKGSSSAAEKKSIGKPITPSQEKKEAEVFQRKEEKEWKEKAKKEEASPLQIESPTTTPLPPASVPIAMSAASNATPYLGTEALAIYMHMVGTIVAMVSPKGDSRTEFVLNAPGFANSKFYGATISIERFATAPYQLNIRLTGSSEAVTLFNQNIPNLMAAFKSGNFSYSINRIEAVYERPLIRRKETLGEKEDKGFEGEMGNRKR